MSDFPGMGDDAQNSYGAGEDVRRPLWVDGIVLVLCAAIFAGMVSLGNWQMDRLAWKTDLIEAVETRAYGTPVAAPRGAVSEDTHAYLRVETHGFFLYEHERWVKAVTELGPGDWLLTPLAADGRVIWINRGFVPDWIAADHPERILRPEGDVPITGLLRVTEPEGTVLERNDPEADRWVSRDVTAMSAVSGLERYAAYFIDAEHQGDPDAWPRGGLTVVEFRNSHLSYALTWYAMALLFAGAMGFVIWDRWRGRGQT